MGALIDKAIIVLKALIVFLELIRMFMVRRLNRFFRVRLTMKSSTHYPNEDADLREFTCENDRVVPFLT